VSKEGRDHVDRAPAADARVARIIDTHGHRSERIIARAQAAGVLAIAALDAATPTLDVDIMSVDPLPGFLVVYGAFVALRLFLLERGPVGDWLVGLSIVVDVAAVVGLSWIFTRNWGQPPPIALKVTQHYMLFVVVALRALQPRPRWVILAGGAAIAARLVLIAAAAFSSDDPMAMIAEDEVAYLGSPLISLPAEADRLLALLFMTVVLAVAVRRFRGLVGEAARSSVAVTDLSRFFDADLARRIADGDVPAIAGTAQVRTAAIAFFDLRGFSDLARHVSGPDLLLLIGEYHRAVLPAVRRHGGSIDKFMGDGVLVSFGAVAASATAEADALAGVVAALEAAGAWQADRRARGLHAPAVGAGLASGPILFGAIGVADRLEYTVIGDAVNVAAKLEKHTKAEGVRALVLGDTYAHARAQGSTVELAVKAGVAVGGIADPLDVALLP
jgi:adenylate cyclase